MVRSLIPERAGLLLVTGACADLQLTPRISQYEGDGVKFKHLAFSDGGAKEITYSPPRGLGLFRERQLADPASSE
jgi:hypothetical protein